MKIRYSPKLLKFLIVIVSIVSCKKKDTQEPELSVTPTAITFPAEGGTMDLSLTCNAGWNITNPVSSWLQLSETSGNSGSTTIHLSTSGNGTGSTLSGILTINSSNGQSRRVTVSQPATIYPSYNTTPKAPDATGMSSTAVQLAANIKLGINIGNTMEADGGETGWGNPVITQSLIDLMKQNGFNAIRIPCAWNLHVDDAATAHISTAWLNRVKQVVQYCINDGMYVVLNIHWDGGWLEQNCTELKKDSVNAKQKAFWEQIATNLRDFDEHLMFASANEPNATTAAQTAVLKSYHATFINAVRATGGKNSYRTLVLQAPSTSTDLAVQYMTTLPVDPVANKLMIEVHYYTPPNFCLLATDASWGNMFYYWGTNYHSTTDPSRNSTFGEESYVDATFRTMKTNFVDRGIPVVLGEFAAIRRGNLTGDSLTLHLASRSHYYRYVTQQAKANGMLPFLWDVGYTDGIFNRQTNTIFDQQALDSLRVGAGL
ncbi:MAG: cellulase family glycosylhydrolase [Chitinophagaceae bacterium]